MFLQTLKNLFHRPAIRMARANNSRIQRGQRSSVRNEGFVSYISENGCLRARNTDSHDTRVRRARLAKNLALAALGAGGMWIVLESARALTLF